MNNAIANLFPGHVATAISHTLIHSLWQGALLSALTGVIMACTRKSSSAMRYNLLVAAMALFAVVVACTFVTEFNKQQAPVGVQADHLMANPSPGPAMHPMYLAAPPSSITETIGSYLNRYASVIVWLWLLMVCARCVQLATGLREVHRLRNKNISSIGSNWEDRVRQLGVQLGIKRLVGIAQSGRAKTPMVIGHLKPLILIPIGMLNSLSTEQAEAVLLHELAHIRRSDYLVNLLQNIMEIVFFFNPAVLWLSALIKAERENCCDDIAVARSGKVNYLKALVACEEYNVRPLPYAMALKVSNSGLKKRVARIISNKSQTLNRGEKSLLAVCLVAAGICAMAFANGGKVDKQATVAQKTAATKPIADSVRIGNEDTVLAQKTIDTTGKHSNANTATGNIISAGTGQKTDDIRSEADSDRTKSIINDMMKDGIITSTTGLSFKIGTDEFVVNYVKQPEAVYQKYQAKYVATQYTGGDDWVWYYAFDSKKWTAIVAHKYTVPQAKDTTTGVFQGKLNL